MKMFLLLLLLVRFFISNTQEFEFSNFESRVKKGKEALAMFSDDVRYKNSECWQSALKMVDSSCKKMSDIHQSYLSLQFTNCHLEKSGLTTYPCRMDNFKECTNEMASNIVAFNSYTQFFTHVSDICFYYQSDIWRERTESTIQKLTVTSEESLQTLSKAVKQQREVLLSQEQSLQNQKDILSNEQLLKETLLSSAQSAKDVFHEVREHANQQKTMFSETFESIFQSVEKLANLQKMLLGEFIGLQSVAFYFVAIIVCYLFTSTPQTAGARLLLFGSLSLLILFERIFVSRRVAAEDENITSEGIHERIWILRKLFLVVATIIIGVFIVRYRDFNKINYSMLQDIQIQVSELRKIQEHQTSRSDTDMHDSTLIPINKDGNDKRLDEATKQLEMSIQSFIASTPHKSNLSIDYVQSKDQGSKSHPTNCKKQYSLAQFSDDDDDILMKKVTRERKKRRKTIETPLNESRYNLRSARNSGFEASFLDNTVKPANQSKVKKSK